VRGIEDERVFQSQLRVPCQRLQVICLAAAPQMLESSGTEMFSVFFEAKSKSDDLPALRARKQPSVRPRKIFAGFSRVLWSSFTHPQAPSSLAPGQSLPWNPAIAKARTPRCRHVKLRELKPARRAGKDGIHGPLVREAARLIAFATHPKPP